MNIIKAKLALPVVSSLLWLASTDTGRGLLGKFGPQAWQRLFLLFQPPTNRWRAQRLALVANLGADLITRVLSDPQTPPAVKKSFKGFIKGFSTKPKRDKLRKQYGIAPALAVVDFTTRCNLKCPGCYNYGGEEVQDLSYETVDRIITELKRDCGVHFIVFSGGEPFLRCDDMFAIAEKHQDISFMVYTNGSLLTDKVVSELVRLGNLSPAISVEGFEKETDERRGPGHFKKVMAAMEQLKRAHVIFGFSATMTRDNAGTKDKPGVLTSDKFIDFYTRQGCLFGWYFQYIPIGREPDPRLMATWEQRSWLAQKINEWRDEGKKIFTGDFWDDGTLVGGCIAAGRRYLHIDGRGNIKLCVFLMGGVVNVHDVFNDQDPNRPYKSIKDVLTKAPAIKEMHRLQSQIRDYTMPCSIIDHPLNLLCLGKYLYPIEATPQGMFDANSEWFASMLDYAQAGKQRCREPYLKGGPFEKSIKE